MSIQTFNNIFNPSDIDYILNLPEVNDAKNRILSRSKGQEYFDIPIPISIQQRLQTVFNINLSRVPMRWIKGDIPSHVDRGSSKFDNTYLIYLTDNEGSLKFDKVSYPIVKNTAYKFAEGLSHETIDTGSVPRLIMGPMSEKGFAVGVSISAPEGSTIYFRQTTDVQYSTDNQVSWNNLGNNYPILISNSTPSPTQVVKVEFVSDITFDNSVPGGVFKYFICGTTHIQFGSESLKNDGSRPIITIDGVANYPGLIQNGTSIANGLNYVYIYNLVVNAINGSTLASGSGWLAATHFARASSNNYIVNCSSDGNLPGNGNGGIVGIYAALDGGTLNVIGCSSSGSIGQYDGGIIGSYAGENSGTVYCNLSWSTGSVSDYGGGIIGEYAGRNNGYVYIYSCYSTGNIGSNGGGILGQNAGDSGQAYADSCYSRGNVDALAGGIFSIIAGSSSGITSATNCYSNGTIATSGNGIYGSGKQNGTESNCYIANGSWNDITANSNLLGTPSPVIGGSWIYAGSNIPYELKNMGYTPYSLVNINTTPFPTLNQNFSESIDAGSSSTPAIVPGRVYTILAIEKNGTIGNYPSITVDITTGVVTTTTGTDPGNYIVYVRNTGSYNITLFTLTISSSPFIPCLTAGTTVLTPHGYVPVEMLKVGDKVLTDDKRKVDIVNIIHTSVEGNNNTYPCCIPKNSISKSYPKTDFTISQNHLIKYKDYWVLPKLIFPQDTSLKNINYYHIQLPDYKQDHLVIENGTVVESFSSSVKDTEEYYKRIQDTMKRFFSRKKEINDKYKNLNKLLELSYHKLLNESTPEVWSENLNYFALGIQGNYAKINIKK